MLKQFFAILWRFLFLFLCSGFLIVFNWGVLFSFLLRKKVRVSLGYLFCIWSMSGACACFSALSCIYIFLSCIIFHYIFIFVPYYYVYFEKFSSGCCPVSAVFVLCFCTKSVRLLGMFFLDIAVVFFGRCYCFPWMQLFFPRTLLSFFSASAVFVLCFCTKLLGICTKQNIFCTKSGENFSMFFQFFPDIFYPDLELFCFFP